MRIGIADADAEKPVARDIGENLIVGRDHGLRQRPQQSKDRVAGTQVPHCQLSHHKRMGGGKPGFKQADKFCLAIAQMVDPD